MRFKGDFHKVAKFLLVSLQKHCINESYISFPHPSPYNISGS